MTAPRISSATTPRTPSLADIFAGLAPQQVQPSATQVALPQRRPIAGETVLVPQRQEPIPLPLSPTTMERLQATLGEIQRDPLGAIVGMAKGLGQDIWTLFAVVPEELENPRIALRLSRLGIHPQMLRPLAELNRKLIDNGFVEDPRGNRFGAGVRISALAAGGAAARVAGAVIGPTTTITGRLGAGLVESVAFGTIQGALTPLEEGQTRAGNIITSTVLAVPLITAGGLVSLAGQRFLLRKGINPKLEAAEITPADPSFNPRAEVRGGAAFVESEVQALRRIAGRQPAFRRQRRPRPSAPTTLEAPTFQRRGTVPPSGPEAQVIRQFSRRPPQRPPSGALPTPIEAANRGNLPPGGSDIIDKLSIGARPPRRPFSWDEFYTRYLDDLHPINVAVNDLLRLMGREGRLRPGERLPPIDDAYVMGRLSRGSVGKATAFLESGPLDFKTLQPVGPSLRDILRPAVKASQVDALRAFLVSQRTVELSGRGIKTPFNLASAKSVVQNTVPEVRAIADQALQYQRNVLKYLEDSGVLSSEQVRAMQSANQAYVPFYRFIEEQLGPTPPGGPPVSSKRFANLTSGLRRIKGSERPGVIDPLESIVRNTYAMVRLADRQAVSDALVRLAEQVPEQTIVRRVRPPLKPVNISKEMQQAFKEQGIDVPPETLGDLSLTFRPRDRLPPGTFWVLRQGQRQFYEADTPLYNALLDLGREQTPQVFALLSVPARTLRAGATLSPGFIARNPFRDQFFAAVTSKHGFTPVVDLGRGIFQMAERGRLFEQFRRSGAEHAALVRTTATERAGLQRTLDDLLAKGSLLADTFRTVRGPKGWLEGLRVLSETMENATRSQEFVRALAQTGDPRLAGFAGREVTLDFARMGTQVRVLNQIIPFFNANLQGVDKAIRAFRDNPARATALAVGYITLPSMALYFLNHDDEHYNELSEARRDFFWNFPLWRFNEAEGRLEKTGEFFSAPKPFELGLTFGTYPERVLRWLKDNDPEAFAQLGENTLSAFTPTVLPTALAVPVQAISGFDFFTRRPIVPEREKRLLPPEQAGPLQGETVRLVGQAFNVSPRIVQNVVRGLTGGLGEGALTTADLILEQFGVQGPTEPRTGAERVPLVGPLISQFLVREPTVSSKSGETFYRNWEQIEGTMNTVRDMARQGRGTDAAALARTNRVEMAAYTTMLETSQALASLQRGMRAIRANRSFTQEEREARLLTLGRAWRTLARNANDAYRLIRERLREQEGRARAPTLGTSVQPAPTPVPRLDAQLEALAAPASRPR